MHRLISILLTLPWAVCCMATEAPTQEAQGTQIKTQAVSPTVRIRKALMTELLELDGKEHKLTELLQLFGKIANENFILDPSLPASVGETKVRVRVQKGGTVLDAFGVALALTGLRYAILDGAVFISTEGKLADMLLYGSRATSPVGTSKARQPLTVSEVVSKKQVFDPHQDGFVTARNFISHAPWRHWEPPRYNPKTGLTDYPGPPIWIEDPDIGHPRFRYTSTPFFLKPEYLALEQEKREYRDEAERMERAQRRDEARALESIIQLMKKNPDMSAKDILEKLRAGEQK